MGFRESFRKGERLLEIKGSNWMYGTDKQKITRIKKKKKKGLAFRIHTKIKD